MSKVARIISCGGGVGVREATLSAVESNKFSDFLGYVATTWHVLTSIFLLVLMQVYKLQIWKVLTVLESCNQR